MHQSFLIEVGFSGASYRATVWHAPAELGGHDSALQAPTQQIGNSDGGPLADGVRQRPTAEETSLVLVQLPQSDESGRCRPGRPSRDLQFLVLTRLRKSASGSDEEGESNQALDIAANRSTYPKPPGVPAQALT